jgi:hypothetical protein
MSCFFSGYSHWIWKTSNWNSGEQLAVHSVATFETFAPSFSYGIQHHPAA